MSLPPVRRRERWRRLALLLVAVVMPLGPKADAQPRKGTAVVLGPTVGFMGVSPRVKGSHKQEPEKARDLEVALVREGLQPRAYARFLGPDEALEQLGGRAGASQLCDEFKCMKALARQLSVGRLITAQLQSTPDDYALHLHLYVTGEESLREVSVRAGRDVFEGLKAEGAAMLEKLIGSSLSSFGRLTIRTNVKSSEIYLNDRPVGRGSFDQFLPGGSYDLRVTAEGSPPYGQEVVLARSGARTVQVVFTREERPALFTGTTAEFSALPVVDKAPERPFELPRVFKHPGFYVAVAGVATAAVGLFFGIRAKGIESRAQTPNPDGRLDVTRAQAQAAATQAALCNVLLVAGGAAAATGATWLYLFPVETPPSKIAYPDSLSGVGVGVGGRF